MHYQFDLYGRFSGLSDTATARSTEVEPPELTPDYNWSGTGWVHAPDIPTAPIVAAAPEPLPPVSRKVSKLAYMDRFTDVELTGIYTAAKASVEVEIWLERFKLASDVDLDDPRTVAGVQALETAGLIATGRAGEILG